MMWKHVLFAVAIAACGSKQGEPVKPPSPPLPLASLPGTHSNTLGDLQSTDPSSGATPVATDAGVGSASPTRDAGADAAVGDAGAKRH